MAKKIASASAVTTDKSFEKILHSMEAERLASGCTLTNQALAFIVKLVKSC